MPSVSRTNGKSLLCKTRTEVVRFPAWKFTGKTNSFTFDKNKIRLRGRQVLATLFGCGKLMLFDARCSSKCAVFVYFLQDESVEGILTILCNHSFHGSCLSKWSDTR